MSENAPGDEEGQHQGRAAGSGEDLSADTPREVAAAGRAVAAALGASIGGPGGAALGAVTSDYFVDIAGRAWGELRSLRGQSVGRLMEHAAQQLDVEADDMVDEALRDERAAQHLGDALHAASQTLSESKIKALATALANGLRHGGARIDVENLVLHALADLEPVHVQALAAFATVPRTVRLPLAGADLAATPAVMATLRRHALIESDEQERAETTLRDLMDWVLDELKSRDREVQPGYSAPHVGARLKDSNEYVEARWQATAFGRYCLKYLVGHHDRAGAG